MILHAINAAAMLSQAAAVLSKRGMELVDVSFDMCSLKWDGTKLSLNNEAIFIRGQALDWEKNNKQEQEPPHAEHS